MVLLQETKCSEEELKKIVKKFFKACEVIGVDATGAARGLGILWNPKEVTLKDFRARHYHLSTAFHNLGTSIWGMMSNIYGPSTSTNKKSFLESLQWMGNQIGQNNWILGGDFNLVRNLGEREEDQDS